MKQCLSPLMSRYLHFGYDVIRLWEIPAQNFLAGGLATLPLAPLAKVTKKELPLLIRQMEAKVSAEAQTPSEVRTFWASTYLLMGLRYSAGQIDTYLKGIQQLKESSTYQAILAEGREEGREEGIRATIFRLGGKRFGTPSQTAVKMLSAVHSLETLEALSEKLLEVESWDELLSTDE